MALLNPADVESAQSFDQIYAHHDNVLKRYVADDRVNYSGVKDDPKAQEVYLESAACVRHLGNKQPMTIDCLFFLDPISDSQEIAAHDS